MFGLIDQIIVTPIVNILFVIYNFVGDFGIAIILFTIIVKFLTWPIMKKTLAQSQIMRKMQPELAKIKKECQGNRQLETLRTMEVYRKYNFRPFRSIFTFLLQIPIFIALFTSIHVMVSPTEKDNISIRAYPATINLSRIHDISEKQTEFLKDTEHNKYEFYPKLFNIIDLSVKAGFNDFSRISVFFFCLVAAFMQYLIAKESSPKKPKKNLRTIFKEAADGKEADQSEISNIVNSQMIKIMPLMMLSININFPGALVFYYMINNIIYYLQQKFIIKKDFDSSDNTDALPEKYKNAKEAEVITKKSNQKHITRISAKVKKGRKK